MKVDIYREKATYENNGKMTEYYKYFLILGENSIYVKPIDATAKQLLNKAIRKDEEDED